MARVGSRIHRLSVTNIPARNGRGYPTASFFGRRDDAVRQAAHLPVTTLLAPSNSGQDQTPDILIGVYVGGPIRKY